jgi:DNA transformation protein and related proteins
MSVSPSFQSLVLDQLGRVVPRVRARKMFGGVGLYADDLFFALIDDDALYLKADEQTRDDFLARGMTPFQPFGEGTQTMQYYRLDADLLEDADELRPWVDRALDAARRKPAKKRKK